MSVFDEILSKVNDLSKASLKSLNNGLEEALACLDKFEVEHLGESSRGQAKTLKDKNTLTTLQRINEDEEKSKNPKNDTTTIKLLENGTNGRSSNESTGSQRGSKKRTKNEVDGIDSPKQDKRQKRNASAKASANISKQVNLTLNQKLRREVVTDKLDIVSQEPRRQMQREDDKENLEPIPIVKIKQEKVSLPTEPVDLLLVQVEVKEEIVRDAIAMPPPAAPVPKSRKMLAKEKSEEETSGANEMASENARERGSTRTRKQADHFIQAVESRSMRCSARSARRTQLQVEDENTEESETRSKRTRAKKKAKMPADDEGAQASQESALASPAEKPRPKRTRRQPKAPSKEEPKPIEDIKSPIEKITSPIEERVSQPEVVVSPTFNKEANLKEKERSVTTGKAVEIDLLSLNSVKKADLQNPKEEVTTVEQNKMNATVTISNDVKDETVVLMPNEVDGHAPVTSVDNTTNIGINLNETMILKHDGDASEKQQNSTMMNATVILERLPVENAPKISDDNSLLTNDSDSDYIPNTPQTPPKQMDNLPQQPKSAVKEKVQQFEELASRVTRTKTRAMAKKEQEVDNQTPTDKVLKPMLSTETLTKMNSLIFSEKLTQSSNSTSKPRPVVAPTRYASSASKLSAINKAREAEEGAKKEKEDARKKKEAMLEAKREMHRKKREEKMAAAAAARVAAERERKLAVEAMEKERREKQAQANQGRVDKLKEVEKKKQELARKAAETEERRKAEEQARQARLAEEHRRAEALRKKQIEETEALKKEAVIMAREIEKKKKEYIEKQKMKHNRHEEKMHTPLKMHGSPAYTIEPVYMLDGFQYLNSDEDYEPVARPVPEWSTSKGRFKKLAVQSRACPLTVDRLFSLRVHSPDLKEIFPRIDRSRLKRTSSAVWRTPPSRLPDLSE